VHNKKSPAEAGLNYAQNSITHGTLPAAKTRNDQLTPRGGAPKGALQRARGQTAKGRQAMEQGLARG
jgi:hypothetical protein